MAQGRTLSEKTEDTKRTYEILREKITPQSQLDLLEKLTGADAQAAVALASGNDPRLYAQIVASSIDLQRIVAANNRTAMMAAAMLNASGVIKPVVEEEL